MLQFYSYPTGKLLVSAADQLYMTQMLRFSPGYKPAAIRVYLYCSLAFVVYKFCGSGKDNETPRASLFSTERGQQYLPVQLNEIKRLQLETQALYNMGA